MNNSSVNWKSNCQRNEQQTFSPPSYAFNLSSKRLDSITEYYWCTSIIPGAQKELSETFAHLALVKKRRSNIKSIPSPKIKVRENGKYKKNLSNLPYFIWKNSSQKEEGKRHGPLAQNFKSYLTYHTTVTITILHILCARFPFEPFWHKLKIELPTKYILQIFIIITSSTEVAKGEIQLFQVFVDYT